MESTGDFGALLRYFRLAASLSQETLAERAGLSVRAISDLERGARRVPRPETVSLLVEALGLVGEDRAALIAPLVRLRAPGGRAAATAPDASAPPPVAALPVLPVPLVGRERETADLVGLLRDGAARLVTLTGTPALLRSPSG
ncbi:MAG: helix-turn-helix transcriptional regulator [Chloroflexia bacterium]